MATKEGEPKKRRFEAFATTAMNDGPRTPIEAERIVISLGKDSAGRPLELSISLDPSNRRPGALTCFSTIESFSEDQADAFPIPVVEKGRAMNVFYVSIKCRPLRGNVEADTTSGDH